MSNNTHSTPQGDEISLPYRVILGTARTFVRQAIDPRTGEANLTYIGEQTAWELGHGEWLDDESHPVWTAAVEAAAEAGALPNEH